MHRTGLAMALTVAVVVGVVFAIYPQFDLDLAGWFYNPTTHRFYGYANGVIWQRVEDLRDLAETLIALLVAPAILAMVGKLVLPRRRMLIGGRAALFLIVTLALGPGLLTNLVLKDHWGRYRPFAVTEFGGTDPFTPWWDFRGTCEGNCSFIAGEPSGGFWTLAPAALAPPQWRVLAYGGAIAFGAALGILRMASGAHFFTDVVFAGVITFLVVWTVHGLIFRWRATRLADEAVADALGDVARRAAVALRSLLQWRGGDAGKPS